MDSGYMCAWESKRHGSFVNNDTQRAVTVPWTLNSATAWCSRGVRTADCGRRSAVIVGSADWQQTYFLFRDRDVAITMNCVKILHAARSAITAIAELLVFYRPRYAVVWTGLNAAIKKHPKVKTHVQIIFNFLYWVGPAVWMAAPTTTNRA